MTEKYGHLGLKIWGDLSEKKFFETAVRFFFQYYYSLNLQKKTKKPFTLTKHLLTVVVITTRGS